MTKKQARAQALRIAEKALRTACAEGLTPNRKVNQALRDVYLAAKIKADRAEYAVMDKKPRLKS